MFTLLTIRKRTAFHQLANLPSDCSSIRWGLTTLITCYQSQAVCWSVFNQGQTLNSFNFSSNTCCRLHLFLVINRITINDCSLLIFHWAGFSSTSLPSKNMKKKGKKSPLTRKDSVHEESMEVCSKQFADDWQDNWSKHLMRRIWQRWRYYDEGDECMDILDHDSNWLSGWHKVREPTNRVHR